MLLFSFDIDILKIKIKSHFFTLIQLFNRKTERKNMIKS